MGSAEDKVEMHSEMDADVLTRQKMQLRLLISRRCRGIPTTVINYDVNHDFNRLMKETCCISNMDKI